MTALRQRFARWWHKRDLQLLRLLCDGRGHYSTELGCTMVRRGYSASSTFLSLGSLERGGYVRRSGRLYTITQRGSDWLRSTW